MMKLKYYLALGIGLTSVILTGCSKDNDDIAGADKISLHSGIDLSIPVSRSLQEEQIAANQEVSLFITKSAGEMIYNNERLVADGSGKFTHNDLFYPMDGSSINLYAVHPYNSSYALNQEIDFFVEANQATSTGYLASDLLYVSVPDKQRDVNPIELKFKHKLSKLKFTIIEGEGGDRLTELNNLSVLNVKNSITMHPKTGTLGSVAGDANSTITPYGVRGATGNETEVGGMSAIIVPQTVPAGTKLLKITIGNVDYYYTTVDNLDFNEGVQYHLRLKIKQNGIELTSSIEKWNDGDIINGEGEEENV